MINSLLNINSTNNDLVVEFNKNKEEVSKLDQCKSYGVGEKVNFISIKSFAKNNYKIKIKLEFLK